MKKCSKKVLAATVAAAMIATMGASTVFAAESGTTTVTNTSDNSTLNTNVKYAVTAGYEWTIHSAIDFGSNAGINKTVEKSKNTVSVSKNIIPDGKTLKITVAGSGDEGAFTIANGNTKLDYTVKADESSNDITTGGEVLSVPAGINTGSKDLTFTLTTSTGTAEVAGAYTGIVTYTASVVDAN